jgi:hypothetical protein
VKDSRYNSDYYLFDGNLVLEEVAVKKLCISMSFCTERRGVKHLGGFTAVLQKRVFAGLRMTKKESFDCSLTLIFGDAGEGKSKGQGGSCDPWPPK